MYLMVLNLKCVSSVIELKTRFLATALKKWSPTNYSINAQVIQWSNNDVTKLSL